MKSITKVIFASALMLAAAAPTLSHAAYFVDQTKTWAVSPQPDVMGKKIRVDRALDGMAFLTIISATSTSGKLEFLNQH